MHEPATALHTVDLASLGERLSAMRLCDAASLTAMRNSLAQHGQLTAPTVFGSSDQLEILDGFKRARAARALGWPTLLARVDPVDSVEAKLRVCALHDSRSLTELEEGWLVRSLYREDGLSLPEIARRMARHRSWVWRRLMLVESLDASVQADVRLGLLAARAAVAVSRLPRGNQQAASTVVMRRGLMVRQTELLVDEVLCVAEPDTAAALLARRLEERSLAKIPGPRSTRAVRNEADWMSADILKAREVAARLQARLGASRLDTFTPGPAAPPALRPSTGGSPRPPRLDQFKAAAEGKAPSTTNHSRARAPRTVGGPPCASATQRPMAALPSVVPARRACRVRGGRRECARRSPTTVRLAARVA